MKKLSVVAGVFALGAGLVGGQAMAACTGSTRLNATEIANTLPGKYVCSKQGGSDWKWQELHQGNTGATSGALIDYKKGPNDPVDPSKTVGTWAITTQGSNALVEYNYTAFGTSGPYRHSVHNNGNGTYSFCPFPSGTEVIATLQTGSGCQ